ncbi:MAG TPA: response regulator [Spirochaetota bacterium]|nr:response regulator [Spirochaetota bacterium]
MSTKSNDVKKTILLVEDEPIIALAQAETIRQFGYDVMVSFSGKEAVLAANGDASIDLVLMDIDLGGEIDGPEAAVRILKTRGLPIVFISSHAERDMVEKVRGITRYGYIIKNSGDFVLRSSIEMALELFGANENILKIANRNRALLDAIPDPMFLFNRDGLLVDYNAPDARDLIVEPERFIGRNVGDVLPAYLAELTKSKLKDVFDTGMPQIFEYEAPVHGEPRFYESRLVPCGNETALAIVRDITDRQRNEDMLKAANEELSGMIEEFESANEDLMISQHELELSESKYRGYIDNAPDGVILADREGSFVEVNTAACAITGYEENELLRLSIPDLVTREFKTPVMDLLHAAVKSGTARGEFMFAHKNGTLRWLFFSAAKLSNSHLLGFIKDITGRKRDELALQVALKRSRRQLDALAELSVSPALVSGNISLFAGHLTEVAAHIAGVERASVWRFRQEAEELHCLDLYELSADRHSSGAVLHREEYQNEFEALRSARYVDAHEALTDPRTAGYVETYFKPLRITSLLDSVIRISGRILGVLCLEHVDVSHHWEPDEISFSCQLADQLAICMLIADRDRAEKEHSEMEKQLRQAQKIEAVGRLAGGLAHDFNNILHVITGNAQLALKDVEPSGLPAECLHEILRAGERSGGLIRQLLAFARRQTITPAVLNLNETIGSMQKMLGGLAGREIELIWKPGVDLPPVKMDPSQVDQIITNLVVNARDAISGGGKVIIETGVAELDETDCATRDGCVPGLYIMLAVSDDGCGMDKETQAQVFEPFFSTKRVGEGAGLGLATVFGIVRQNNGFIDVRSEPDHGATFTLYLPACKAPEPVGEGEGGYTEPSKVTETILLVDDEESVLNLIKHMAKHLDYTVLAAGGPIEAIKIADEHPKAIHLLLTDVLLPELNGLELWHTLKIRRPELKCLFISGYACNSIAGQGILTEDIPFLQKPFSMDTLAMKIREALEK